MNDYQYQISEIYRMLNNLIQLGTVEKLVGDRVVCRTWKNLVTKPLPLATRRAGDDRDSWLPSPGEQVVIFAPGGITENAVVGPSLWTTAKPAPSTDPNVPTTVYSDGATISYDKKSHALSAILPAGATVTLVSDGGISFKGDFAVDGNITSTKNIHANGDVSDKKRTMQGDRDIYNIHAKNNHTPPAPEQ